MKYTHVRSLPRSRASQNSRRRLRDEATHAERVLLRALHEADEPFDFQHRVFTAEAPTGYYVVDFYLPRRRLFVELDGKPHVSEQAKWNDLLRAEVIERAREGTRLVRFWNQQVIDDPMAVVRELTACG